MLKSLLFLTFTITAGFVSSHERNLKVTILGLCPLKIQNEWSNRDLESVPVEEALALDGSALYDMGAGLDRLHPDHVQVKGLVVVQLLANAGSEVRNAGGIV